MPDWLPAIGLLPPSSHLAYLPLTRPRSPTPKGNMTVSQTPSSAAERRLAIARRLFNQALVAQDPDRLITLCDSGGGVVARHDPRPEQDVPDCLIETPAKKEVPTGRLGWPVGTEACGLSDVRASLQANRGQPKPGGNPPKLGDVDIAG